MCKRVRIVRFWKNFVVCVKEEDNISHLPLSLTGWVHPPWSLLRQRIPAVIYSKESLDESNCQINNPLNKQNYDVQQSRA